MVSARPYPLAYTFLIALYIAVASAASQLGCYSLVGTSESLHDNFMSFGFCTTACPNSPYIAIKDRSCYCLSSLPSSGKISDSSCSSPCPGYPLDICGGSSGFSVYHGPSNAAGGMDAAASSLILASLLLNPLSLTSSRPSTLSDGMSSAGPSASSDSSSLPLATKLMLDSTSLPTKTGSSPSSSLSSDSLKGSLSKSNTAAIAGGAVGGIFGAIALAVLGWFLWRRRNRELDDYVLDDETYFDKNRTDSAMGLGIGSVKGPPAFSSSLGSRKGLPMDMPLTNPFANPPGTTPARSDGAAGGLVDPRMNPTMMGRQRLSEGLLADEADYLRKILQVANPDGH